MGKIIFITEYFAPAQTTTGFYLTKIIEKAASFCDNNIEVCCATVSEVGDSEKYKFKITRYDFDWLDKNKLFQRLIKFFLMTLRFSWFAFRHIKQDSVVFMVTNPPPVLLFLGLLRKFRRFKYILLIYDVFPENLIAAKLSTKRSLMYRLALKCFNWAYRAADQLIGIGRDNAEVIAQKVGSNNNISVITNWADTEAVYPIRKSDNPIIKKYNLENKTVFLFAGNLGRLQGIEMLLEAALNVKDKNFQLVFIGSGVLRDKIQKYIALNPNGNVLWAGEFSISEQLTFLNACDVGVVSLDNEMYGLGVPSKSYYYMAAGKPILFVGDKRSEIARVIQEEDIGWIVEPGDVLLLAQTIDDICLSLKKYIADKGDRARDTVVRRFSQKIVLEQYSKLFSRVTR